MTALIHRLGVRGGAKCGAGPDRFQHLNLSLTGAPSAVTCPDCQEKPPNRRVQLAALEAAAKRFRERHGA